MPRDQVAAVVGAVLTAVLRAAAAAVTHHAIMWLVLVLSDFNSCWCCQWLLAHVLLHHLGLRHVEDVLGQHCPYGGSLVPVKQ
jgi:hypothetical protein